MQTLLADLMTREWGASSASAVDRHRGRRRRLARRGSPTASSATVGGAARQRAVPPDRRRRPRAAAALPARPPRPHPGRCARRARRATHRATASGPARSAPGDPDLLARSLLLPPTASPLGPHDDRRPPSTEADLDAELADLSEVPRAMTAHRRTTRIRTGLRRRPRRARRPLVIGLGVTGAGVALDAASPRPRRGRRRRPRPRLRHLALGVQAGARRPALPRQGPGRRRPRERGRARHPDGAHRPAPDPRRCRC